MEPTEAELEYISNSNLYQYELGQLEESGAAWSEVVKMGWDTYQGYLEDNPDKTKFDNPVVNIEVTMFGRKTYYKDGSWVLYPPIQHTGSSEEW